MLKATPEGLAEQAAGAGGKAKFPKGKAKFKKDKQTNEKTEPPPRTYRQAGWRKAVVAHDMNLWR